VPTGSVGFQRWWNCTRIGSIGADGTAKLLTNSLLPGAHPLTATYAENESYLGSTSKVLNQKISAISDFLLVADKGGMSKSVKAGEVSVILLLSDVTGREL